MSLLGIGIGVFGLVILTNSIGYQIYPHFFISSVAIIGFLGYSFIRYGLLSVPSILGGIVGYPALVPILNRYVFNFPHFTHARAYEGVLFTNMLLFYVFVFFAIFLGILHLFDWASIIGLSSVKSVDFPIYYRRPVFITMVAIYLASAYTYSPGPTILTANYVEILGHTNTWATFAGATYKGAWILLFLLIVGDNFDRNRYIIFILVTFIGATWMLLHGRRVESVGFFLVIAVHLSSIGSTDAISSSIWARVKRSAPLLPVPVMVLVGIVRSTGLSSTALSLTRFFGPDFVSFPSGAHGIYHTYQITMVQFQSGEYLKGETFINYVFQSLPSGFYAFTPFEYPTLYHHQVLADVPTYIGGNYFLNVYFANFGPIGIILAGVVLGLITVFCHRRLSDEIRPTVLTGFAVILFSNGFRSLWYTQLNWVDTFQGFVVALLFYLVASNAVAKVQWN